MRRLSKVAFFVDISIKSIQDTVTMNYLLRIYDDFNKIIHSEEFFASTEITAEKIAMNIAEREFAGLDWTLTKI